MSARLFGEGRAGVGSDRPQAVFERIPGRPPRPDTRHTSSSPTITPAPMKPTRLAARVSVPGVRVAMMDACAAAAGSTIRTWNSSSQAPELRLQGG